jgi:hypothetical protein
MKTLQLSALTLLLTAARIAWCGQALSASEAEAFVHEHLGGWPPATQKLGGELLTQYGKPSEITSLALIWQGNAPWVRTVLYKQSVLHNFPSPHQDVLEQTVRLRVPVDKIGDLAAYDGSIVVDRTRGEVSVHCDSEAHNILTLNIAQDIIKGDRSVDQALAYHAQVIRGVQIGEPETYPQKLRFMPQTAAAAADPGEEAPLLSHLAH